MPQATGYDVGGQAEEVLDEQGWREGLRRGAFGVWDLDTRLEAVSYSPPWKQRLGFAPNDWPDSTSFWRCRVHPDDLAPMLAALHAHMDGLTALYECRFRVRSNGSGYRQVLSRGRVVDRDHQGAATRLVGTMIDVTGRPLVTPATLADTEVAPLAERVRCPLHRLIASPEDCQGVDSQTRARLLQAIVDLLDAALAAARPFTCP